MARQTLVVLFLALLLASAASVYAAEAGGVAPAQPLRAGNSFAEATPLAEGTYEFKWSDKDQATKKYLKLEPKPGSQLNIKLVSKLPPCTNYCWVHVTPTLYNEKHESVRTLAYQ